MMSMFGLSKWSKDKQTFDANVKKSKDDAKVTYEYGQKEDENDPPAKPVKAKPPKQGILETIRSISTNFMFNRGISSITPIVFKKPDDRVYFLGREYAFPNEKEFKHHFEHTIWMTYRKNFPLVSKKGPSVKFSSDNGWGCMLRAGQMLFAEALNRHVFKDLYLKVDTEDLTLIIKAFLEESAASDSLLLGKEISQYSIQKICDQAAKEYNIGAGEWFNPSNICYILKDLHERNPMKEASPMRVVIFNNGMIFLDQIKGESRAPAKKEIDADQEMICEEEVNKQKSKVSEAVLVIYIAQIGLETPNPDYLRFLQELFKIKYFAGMLGGKPGTAYYFLGCYNENQYIYLDPHLVQETVTGAKLESEASSYFCENIRMMNSNSITPSISIGFYLRNMKEIDDFYSNLEMLSKNFDEMCFIGLSLSTPDDFMSDSFEQGEREKGDDQAFDDDWDIIK